MSSPFRAAWMLLKQRGHELNLPEPRRQNVGPNAANMSPQDLTDARVDAHSNAVSEMDKFRDMDVDGYRGMKQRTYPNGTSKQPTPRPTNGKR